jgi:restriction system protein
MAETTRKRAGELLQKLFEILKQSPEGLQASVALERLSKAITLTEHEAGAYPSTGLRRFEKIARFTTIAPVKAGWLVKHRGTWSLTDEGLRAYAAHREPEALYRESVRLYHLWRAARGGEQKLETTPLPDDLGDSEESAAVTFEQAEEQAWNEIENHLRSMNPFDFQQLVADLLQSMGYYVSWVAPPGKDGGVDIIAFTDPLGTRVPRIKVQVKRLGQKVDVDGLKSFMAIISDHDVGLFVSAAGFTRDAEGFARAQERRQITLIDLERLVDLWVEHFGRLSDFARSRLPLTPIYFLTPKR